MANSEGWPKDGAVVLSWRPDTVLVLVPGSLACQASMRALTYPTPE